MNLPDPNRPASLPGDNRRQFFQRGLAIAGGVVTGNEAAIASSCHPDGHDAIRVGLIGCGVQGRSTVVQLLRDSRGDRDVRLVAMADAFQAPLQASFRSLKGRHRDQIDVQDRRLVGVNAWRDLLQCELDLVVIATPPFLHSEQLGASVSAGKHVLLEKPLATTADQLASVVASGHLANRHGVSVMLNQSKRYDRRWQTVVDEVKAGRIGQPLRAHHCLATPWPAIQVSVSVAKRANDHLRDSRRSELLAGDPLFEQFYDVVDLMNWMVEDWPITAEATIDERELQLAYRCGMRYTSHWGRSEDGKAAELIATNGSCDLRTGVLRDLNRRVLWDPSQATNTDRLDGFDSPANAMLQSIREGHPINDLSSGIHNALTVFLARQTLSVGRRA